MKPASNILVRFLTALVAVPLILAAMFLAPGWAFYLLVFPACLLGANELFLMTHHDDAIARGMGVVMTGLVSLALFFFGADLRVVFAVMLAVPLLGPLLTLTRLGDIHTAALRAAAMGFGPLFVGAPLTLLAMMCNDSRMGPGYTLLALGLAWLSDTAGYFAGRFLGKRKLYEAVSPKKTVEGAIGGLFGSTLWAIIGHFSFVKDVPLHHAIPLAIVAGALGQAGDLGESLLKRSTGVKDSGQIVPGHGGILDRVDALFLTSSAVYLYALFART